MLEANVLLSTPNLDTVVSPMVLLQYLVSYGMLVSYAGSTMITLLLYGYHYHAGMEYTCTTILLVLIL